MKREVEGKMIFVLESWENAGTEKYVYLLAKELKKKNINVLLVILGKVDSEHLDSCRGAFGEVCLSLEKKHGVFNKYRALFQVLKNNDCKIVHLHLYSSLLPSVLLAKATKKKIISTFHIPLSVWTWRHKVAWIISSFMSNSNITVATTIKNDFLEKKVGNVTVINPPVNKISQRVKHYNEIFSIVGVGRLSNMQKDWPTLIKAIHILKQKKLNNLRLTICGGGPDEAMLRDMINDLDLNDEVILTGHLDKSAIENSLSSSDLFVLPSKFEGFGIAPVEAMQMGLPTITANYPASQDYITAGITGWTFPIGDSSALAKLIEHLISNKTHREEVAKQGQVLALEKFSPKRIADQHLEIYSKLTN
ncbi:glycosyltransferase family 4 protein [Vibrio sp. 1863]|uniref:glycosyltransferase family 4 protein n=1 Tax=Vibrio sp. 1863 TaxID=3074579 RepID=UPI0029651362|nr:glycosyltransferase family 4 protein [Vibrio sp. 1863]MDW2075373.1 glycosyltransferase family 4 protein [Vibrio sp. 1863]